MTSLPLHKEPSKALIFAAFAGIYIIWGSTYLGILLAIKTIPPFMLVAFRFLLAGALLLGYCFIRGEKIPSARSFAPIALSGIFMLFIGNSAVTLAERNLPTGLVAIIVATVPLWFVLLDKRQWSFYFSNKLIIIGIIIGFAGIILLFAGKGSVDIMNHPDNLWSFLLLLLGTACWAIGSLFSKYKKVEGTTTMKAALQMLAAGIAGLVAAFIQQEPQNFSISQVSTESMWAFVYLVTFGSLIGYMSYIWLLSVRPPSIVGTYAYVNPAVAVLLGWLVAEEKISLNQMVALAVIIAGVVLVNFPKFGEKKVEANRPIKL